MKLFLSLSLMATVFCVSAQSGFADETKKSEQDEMGISLHGEAGGSAEHQFLDGENFMGASGGGSLSLKLQGSPYSFEVFKLGLNGGASRELGGKGDVFPLFHVDFSRGGTIKDSEYTERGKNILKDSGWKYSTGLDFDLKPKRSDVEGTLRFSRFWKDASVGGGLSPISARIRELEDDKEILGMSLFSGLELNGEKQFGDIVKIYGLLRGEILPFGSFEGESEKDSGSSVAPNLYGKAKVGTEVKLGEHVVLGAETVVEGLKIDVKDDETKVNRSLGSTSVTSTLTAKAAF